MFKLKCYGEINGKDITLIPDRTYRVKYRFSGSDEIIHQILLYKSFKDDSLIFRNLNSNPNSNIFISFDCIQYIEELITNKPYCQEDYDDAKEKGFDLDNWNDYVTYYDLGSDEELDE